MISQKYVVNLNKLINKETVGIKFCLKFQWFKFVHKTNITLNFVNKPSNLKKK